MTDALTKRVRLAELYALYGPLLTERQRRIISLYHDHDMSLGEIADETGVSRQAVHDTLARAASALETYEQQIGMHSWHERIRLLVARLAQELEPYPQGLVHTLVNRLTTELAPGGEDDV